MATKNTVIDLTLDSDDDKRTQKSPKKVQTKRVQPTMRTLLTQKAVGTPVSGTKRSASSMEESAEDCIVVSVGNTQVASEMPHARDACTIHSFVDPRKSNKTDRNFRNYCSQCYCYVCQIPVRQCNNWNIHYNGNCYEPKWKEERKKRKLTNTSST